MKLEFSTSDDNTGGVVYDTNVITSHQGRTLEWNVSSLIRKSSNRSNVNAARGKLEEDVVVSDANDVFNEINNYWAQLPIATQDKIFGIYERIHKTFETVWEIDPLTGALQDQIRELLEYHKLDQVGHWVKFYSKIVYPPDLDETFVEGGDHGKTRNRTYTRTDYQDLVILALAIRSVFPIWGLYIHRTRDEVGNTFKEMRAGKLLSRSDIFRSHPMDKLRIYLSEIASNEQVKKKAVFSGLSTSELPDWLLSLAMARRITVAKLTWIPNTPSIIAWIHNYIQQRIGRDGGFNIGEIRKKIPERERHDSEQKLSVLEQFKIKEENPAGDTVFVSYNMRQQEKLLKFLQPDCPMELLKQANKSLKALEAVQIHEGQILIMQNTINDAIPHQGLGDQIKMDVLSSMAVAQAVLIHRGFLELAALMTATAIQSDNMHQMTTMEPRTRITREIFEELNRLFPHARRTNSRNRNSRQSNAASANIDLIVEMLSEHAWRLTLPQEYVARLTGNPSERYYAIPQQIKIILANFVIQNCYRQKAMVEKMYGIKLPDPPPAPDYFGQQNA